MILPQSVTPEVNLIVHLEIELVHCEAAVQYFNHYAIVLF